VVLPEAMLLEPTLSFGVQSCDVFSPIPSKRDIARPISQLERSQAVLFNLKRFETQNSNLMVGCNHNRSQGLGVRKDKFVSRRECAVFQLVRKDAFQLSHVDPIESVSHQHRAEKTRRLVCAGFDKVPRIDVLDSAKKRRAAFSSHLSR